MVAALSLAMWERPGRVRVLHTPYISINVEKAESATIVHGPTLPP